MIYNTNCSHQWETSMSGKQKWGMLFSTVIGLLIPEEKQAITGCNHWMEVVSTGAAGQVSHFIMVSYVFCKTLWLPLKLFSQTLWGFRNQEHNYYFCLHLCCSAGRVNSILSFVCFFYPFLFLHLWKDENWRELFVGERFQKKLRFDQNSVTVAKTKSTQLLPRIISWTCFVSSSFFSLEVKLYKGKFDGWYRHKVSVNSHGDRATSHNSWHLSCSDRTLFFLCGLGSEWKALNLGLASWLVAGRKELIHSPQRPVKRE